MARIINNDTEWNAIYSTAKAEHAAKAKSTTTKSLRETLATIRATYAPAQMDTMPGLSAKVAAIATELCVRKAAR